MTPGVVSDGTPLPLPYQMEYFLQLESFRQLQLVKNVISVLEWQFES
jgi:hypothetical protein